MLQHIKRLNSYIAEVIIIIIKNFNMTIIIPIFMLVDKCLSLIGCLKMHMFNSIFSAIKYTINAFISHNSISLQIQLYHKGINMSRKYYKNIQNFMSIPNYLKKIQSAKTGMDKIGHMINVGNLFSK